MNQPISYARFGKRIKAGIIDFLITGCISVPIIVGFTEFSQSDVIKGLFLNNNQPTVLFFVVLLLPAIIRHIFLLAYRQGEIAGHRVSKTQVISANGKPINYIRAFLRFVVSLPLFFLELYLIGLLIDYLIYRKDERKRFLLDMIVGTAVIDVSQPAPSYSKHSGSPTLLSELCDRLADRNKFERQKAAKTLKRIKHVGATNALIMALDDRDFMVRVYAAEAILATANENREHAILNPYVNEKIAVIQSELAAMGDYLDGSQIQG